MKKSLIATGSVLLAILFLSSVSEALAEVDYRKDLTSRVRESGAFEVPLPSGAAFTFNYTLKVAEAIFAAPVVSDFPLSPTSTAYLRGFWDKIRLQDGSHLLLNGEEVPLTCIYIEGQDNRFSGKTGPLLPDFILKIYLVANDYSCTGPINPSWPGQTAKKETWDTYLYFEVRDPTIMLPVEPKLKYRWNEYKATLIDRGAFNAN